MNEIEVIQTGQADYHHIWHLQKKLFKEVETNRQRNFLILTEHPPVITIGKKGSTANLLASTDLLRSKGIDVIEIDRGGDITYHGPGQLIGYPILNLMEFQKDVHWYLRSLEDVIIHTLQKFYIHGERIEGLTGVWVGNKKICAIGVKVTRWVTMHGFALNVTTNLKHFDYIVPCGISDRGVTSISQESGNNIPLKDVIKILCNGFQVTFGHKLIPIRNSDHVYHINNTEAKNVI